MADNLFHDWYVGCTEEMDEKSPQLLKEELEANEKLKTEGKKCRGKMEGKKTDKQYSDFHKTSPVAYTGHLGIEFSRAVEFHPNSYNFQFKAFHCYLTRALQLLNPVVVTQFTEAPTPGV